jgi:hypothetical protein
MPQAYVTLAAPRRPVKGTHLMTADSSWEVAVASVLTWDDGTQEDVPVNTKILPISGTVDMTTDYWLVVWQQGAPLVPYAIKQKDFGNLETLVGGTFAVSHWITDDAEVWQQV